MRKFILLIGLIMLVFMPIKDTAAFSDQVIQQGAVGDDVIELQTRLKDIGFYQGKVDGVFGWSTYWSVRNFQYEFGMKVDGLVGADMKEKLRATTTYKQTNQQEETAVNVPSGFSQNDIKLMANAVHGEARGEPYEGSRRPSGLRKTTNPDNSLAHRTTWLRSDFMLVE